MVRVLTSVTAFLAVIVIVAGAVGPFVLAVVAFAALQSPLRVSPHHRLRCIVVTIVASPHSRLLVVSAVSSVLAMVVDASSHS